MTIPVVWLKKRRLCWDQSVVDALLTNELGRTGYEFSHAEEMIPERGGAIVVVPARYFSAQEINKLIAPLDWCITICTSDEESLFQWQTLDHPNMRLWIMTPRPVQHDPTRARFIGEGWPSGTHELLKTTRRAEDRRPYEYFFAGQVTHERRQDAYEAMRDLPNGEAIASPGFTQGLPQPAYLRKLAEAKIAPCPAGPATPDSFRLYEALEAGCVPIADAVTPEAWHGYWDLLIGEDELPFPIIEDWADLADMMKVEVEDWPANANRAFAWWQLEKHRMVMDLARDLEAVDAPRDRSKIADLITVVVTTSPIPSHPSTEVISQTIDSIRAQEALADCTVVIAVDGVREEQEDRREDYEEYIRRLLWELNYDRPNTVPVLAHTHLHQANLTRLALAEVRTPLILFVEHDTPLVGKIPWKKLVQPIIDGKADLIRLHHETSILKPHEHLMPDGDAVTMLDDVPLMRTIQWSQRPHLAGTDFYRELLEHYFGSRSRTMIEDAMYGVVDQAWREHGDAGWNQFRLWIYAPSGDMKRSTHLDGRGVDQKYEMIYEYDGPVPEGAPYPTSGRTS